MIFSITNPTELVDWLQIFCKSGWLSPWDPPLQWGKVHERIYRPATHPIYFAADSPDKIHRCAAWAVFFFMGNVPWKFHKPTGRDTDFSSTPLHKQGQELRSEQTVTLYMSSTTSTCFCALKIRKQLPRNGFERSGRGQESSRGHKFSILENFLSPLGLFLVGACLPQTLLGDFILGGCYIAYMPFQILICYIW